MLAADEKPRFRQNGQVLDTARKSAIPIPSSRNVTRGVWELARLHTREAWLCWYPASKQRLSYLGAEVESMIGT